MRNNNRHSCKPEKWHIILNKNLLQENCCSADVYKMSKIETKLKALTLNLKYAEKVKNKKEYVAKCGFRGKCCFLSHCQMNLYK